MVTRSVAVVGASGQLGRAVVAAFERRPGWQVRPLGHEAIEIADRESIARALDPAPAVVVNSTLGDWSRQEDTEHSLRVNTLGARLLAERCAAMRATLVHVSTAYVFDGEASAPYRESDRAAPRSVYGITKLAGEQLVRAVLPEHLIVRVDVLYGPGGSRAKRGTNFVTDMLDAARSGKPVRVVTDQVSSTTYTPDAAETIVRLVEAGVTGTAHVTNIGWCSRYAFAAKIFELAGLEPQLVPIRLADLPPGPHRPRYTVLAHETLHQAGIAPPRPWPDALHEYLVQTGRLRNDHGAERT
ncbi:MAG TPA: dTDP-4-dehydrorhamnose reductase [Chloroflexota bacterium]|nr:dTDP-4-dehydrorhamnose reductase [Chloroflexota bacterium]